MPFFTTETEFANLQVLCPNSFPSSLTYADYSADFTAFWSAVNSQVAVQQVLVTVADFAAWCTAGNVSPEQLSVREQYATLIQLGILNA
jgi:hypothetical protein